MEIPKRLVKFKLQICLGIALCLLIFTFIYVAPSFLDLLAYFWPLLFSTAALALVAGVLFGQLSASASESRGIGKETAEDLLDFVAGRAPEPVDAQLHHTHDHDHDHDHDHEEEEKEEAASHKLE